MNFTKNPKSWFWNDGYTTICNVARWKNIAFTALRAHSYVYPLWKQNFARFASVALISNILSYSTWRDTI